MSGLKSLTTGLEISEQEGQDRIRRTIERMGYFVLGADCPVKLGDVQEWCGLPMRVVRFITEEEAKKHDEGCRDIWFDELFFIHCVHYFVVEVAD